METRWGKESYLTTSREDIREALTILASYFTDSLFSLVYSSIDLDVFKREVIYGRFLQFWLIFPKRNYQSRSIGYNFN